MGLVVLDLCSISKDGYGIVESSWGVVWEKT